METDLAILGIEIRGEGFEETLDKLDVLDKKGSETARKFKALQFQIPQQTKKKTRGNDPVFADLGTSGTKVASDLTGVLSKVFDGFLIRGREAESVLKSLEKDLLRLGGSYVGAKGSTGDLFKTITSGAGDLLTNLFPGFASGGQFTVGGAAGRDRNLVGLRLTRGEKVSVQTPSQQKVDQNMNSSQNVSLSFNITTPDAESFRRSQSQIQGEALRSAQRILKRNG